MTFLITGATGTVGRNVIDQLIELDPGTQIRALTRNPDAELPAGVEVAVGDLSEPDTLTGAFDGITAVHFINFAGDQYAPLAEPGRIVALAEAAGVKRATVLGGRAEGDLEQALIAGAIETTFLHPVEFMSNTLMWWAAAIRAEGTIREPFGDRVSAMIHPADIGAVAAKILADGGHDGQEYVLTGPEAVPITEKVRILGEAIGRELEFVELTVEQAREKWAGEGMGEDMIAFLIEALGNTPEEGRTVASTVERLVGRPPRSFAQWAAEHADAFR
ncbi:NAD(P)H-binding protein [Glycomyces buryatensis]|uniref:NAD-dependent epimerase/dehydratase family protein n=1 Tax=Glycomyces buryatensis TaxID=2570927 RepID=A0A4S8QEU0_9ACTN|nr:NAD(P)H-binding protein [Glycomyces buryatensis]THV42191.1 NAD-dependent epimerase/dehydratase family protein [Glycomyces buryatensis]